LKNNGNGTYKGDFRGNYKERKING